MPGIEGDNLDALRQEVGARAKDVCLALLGEPASRTQVEWRYGRRGSLAVAMRGHKRGLWYDHEAGAGGDLFDLIRRQRGGDFAAALAWARDFLRLPRRAQTPPTTTTATKDSDENDAVRLERARRFWREAGELPGSVAERYLTMTRGIPAPAAGWPACLRYHRRRRALIVAATDDAGEVRAVQLVHLTTGAAKRPADDEHLTKQSFGLQDDAAVRLPACGDGDAPLLLAEGPETGLSLWTATGRETWIALGGVGKLHPPLGRRLVVCADDDLPDKPAAKALRKAVGRWRAEGFAVALAYPWARRRRDKSDFNDLLLGVGPGAVAQRIEAAAQGAAHSGVQAVRVDVARARLRAAVDGFFTAARGFDPDDPDRGCTAAVHGIRGGVGTGKSDAALRAIAWELAAMRTRGDQRTFVVAVPRHALADEQAVRFMALPEAAGLTAAGWRGREAPDPTAPGEMMCRNIEAVRDAQSIGARVEESACHRSKGGQEFHCAFAGVCGAQRQKHQRADVWFVPHELLFAPKPAALGKLFAVVVDEAAWPDGLEGVDGRGITFALDALHGNVVVPDDFAGRDTQRLRDVHRRVIDALHGQSVGPLRRDVMLAAGITAETAKDGRVLTWLRKVDPGLRPGMTLAERRAAMAAARDNPAVIRLARFFGALEALLAEDGPATSGWITLETQDTDHGPVRVLRLRGRREVDKGWQVPTLLIDALLNPALARPYWPALKVTAEVEAETPHMRVRQLIGRDWSKSALVPDEDSDEVEAARRRRQSRKLRAAVLREARRMYDGRHPVLVVAPKAIKEAWREAGELPPWLLLAHHNGVAGSDEYRDVCGLIVVSRTQGKPSDVERMAEALTGAAVAERVKGYRYPREDAPILLRDGRAETGEADRHPDPAAEAIRWQICEGELVQIVGRGRGVNRTKTTPLDVLILTDRPLPLLVDATVTWEELMPGPTDMMLNEGGVTLSEPVDMASAYPGLWASHGAAKKALQRAPLGTFPFEESSIGECPRSRLVGVSYQKAGKSHRVATALFDPEVVRDLEGWLIARLGPLARFEIALNPGALVGSAKVLLPTHRPNPSRPTEAKLDIRVSLDSGKHSLGPVPKPEPLSARELAAPSSWTPSSPDLWTPAAPEPWTPSKLVFWEPSASKQWTPLELNFWQPSAPDVCTFLTSSP